MAQITKEIAELLWSYDPQEGVFLWLISPRSDMPSGSVAGTISFHGYRILCYKGKKYRAARVAVLLMTGRMPIGEVDHIDGDCQNDKWNNLREASRPQNACNTKTRSDNVLGLRGVCAHAGGYIAYIGFQKKRKYLGLFKTAEEAKAAYDAAAAELHGEFRRAA